MNKQKPIHLGVNTMAMPLDRWDWNTQLSTGLFVLIYEKTKHVSTKNAGFNLKLLLCKQIYDEKT